MQKLLTVRIDGSLLQRLRVATVQRDTTIAEVVRQGLDEWLSKNPGRSSGGASKTASSKATKARGSAAKSATTRGRR